MSRQSVLADQRFAGFDLPYLNQLFSSMASVMLNVSADESDKQFLRDLSDHIAYRKEVEQRNAQPKGA